MKIIIVGAGKAGIYLARILSENKCDVTVIEKDAEKARRFDSEIDARFITGNGYSSQVLLDNDIKKVDAFIAVTRSDEANIIGCINAKKLGAEKAIARVRQFEYSEELISIQKSLAIDMVVNPDRVVAEEIARNIIYSINHELEDRSHGNTRIINVTLPPKSILVGKALKDLDVNRNYGAIIGTVIRNDEVVIPRGDFVLEEKDKLLVIGTVESVYRFYKETISNTQKVKRVMLIGGSRLAIYLSRYLNKNKIAVKLLEKNETKCHELAQILPNTTILHGDGCHEQVLRDEQANNMDAFLGLTNQDEDNLFATLMAKEFGVSRIWLKSHQVGLKNEVLANVGIANLIRPYIYLGNRILSYINVQNTQTLFKIADDRISILELLITEESAYVNKQLKDIELPSNSLIALINRNDRTIIPTGMDVIEAQDTIIMITTNSVEENEKLGLFAQLLRYIRK